MCWGLHCPQERIIVLHCLQSKIKFCQLSFKVLVCRPSVENNGSHDHLWTRLKYNSVVGRFWCGWHFTSVNGFRKDELHTFVTVFVLIIDNGCCHGDLLSTTVGWCTHDANVFCQNIES